MLICNFPFSRTIAKRDLKKATNVAAMADGNSNLNKMTVAVLKAKTGATGEGGMAGGEASDRNNGEDSSDLSDHTFSSADDSSDEDSASMVTGSDDQISS